jgi:hypothetical protein
VSFFQRLANGFLRVLQPLQRQPKFHQRDPEPRGRVQAAVYRCGFCREQFSTFTDLHVHVQRVHVRGERA